MGNCQKGQQTSSFSNFHDDKWAPIPTIIHPNCYLLKNYNHSKTKLLKWVSSSHSSIKIVEFRQQNKYPFLPNIYESGTCPNKSCSAENSSQNSNCQSTYIISEQLVRLKDLTLSEEQAVVIAFQSLKGYQQMTQKLGGFIARESMIFINREGVIKLWVNENIGEDQFQYPHPKIHQNQFISSLLHQIFTRSTISFREDSEKGSFIYNYIKSGELSFKQVISRLGNVMQQNGLQDEIRIQKQNFQRILESYEMKNNSNKKDDIRKRSASKGYSFIVANGHQNSRSYVKDYSQKIISDRPFSQRKSSNAFCFQEANPSSPQDSSFSIPRNPFIIVNESLSYLY